MTSPMISPMTVRKSLALALAALALLASPFASTARAETKNFEVVAVEISGVKFWLPSTFFAKKGDTVHFHLVSKVPGASSSHGFAIDAYNIQEVVDAKGTDVKFTADKEGVFQIRCQLHPAHVGGQLIVE